MRRILVPSSAIEDICCVPTYLYDSCVGVRHYYQYSYRDSYYQEGGFITDIIIIIICGLFSL